MSQEKIRRIEIIKSELHAARFRGAANTCPNCGKRGFFGSVVKYNFDKETDYLICGWCKRVSKTRAIKV